MNFSFNATLQYHLDRFIEIDPEFVRVMKKSFYVDDIVTGQTTSREAGELYEKAKTRLAISGFKLRKSLTNSKELKAKITKREMRGESNVDKQIESADESYAKATIGAKVKTKSEKIPGLSWNCESDTFVFELSEMVEKADGLPVPKRNILKVFAGMYDPLGFLSPVIVGMKVLSQELCVSKVDWDERITSEIEKSWIGWLRDLKETKEIHVPRCVHGIGQGKLNCLLHGFADASRKAYCAIIYFVCEVSGAVSSTLLTSKTRVSYQDLTSKWKLEDHGGVLKCRRRLENSDLDMKAQQPIILAKDHRLTKLLIEECHRKVHHRGVRATLGELRSRLWVPKGRQVVKKVLREYVTCKKEQCKPFEAPPTAA